MIVLVIAVLVAAAMEPMLPALMKPLVDESLESSRPDNLWVVPLLLVVVVLVRGIADYLITYCSQYLAHRTVEDLRQALYAKELELSLSQHSHDGLGRMVSRITYDPQLVADSVSEVWMVLVRDSFVLLGLLLFLFYTSWELAFFVFIALPILIVAIRKIGRRLRVSSVKIQDQFGSINGFLQESLLGLSEIKIFNGQHLHECRFHGLNLALRLEQMRAVKISGAAGPLVGLLTAITVALVIFYASVMSSRGILTPGEFVAFITALAMVFGPIRRLAAINNTLQKGLAASDAIFELLDMPDERGAVQSCSELIERHRSRPRISVPRRAIGHISFSGVSFTYPSTTTPVIENLTFEIAPREVVLLSAPSGSGKSTVLQLLMRFYEPQAGYICLDGIPLADWSIEELRSNISIVAQRVILFDGTIAENIQLGRSGASHREIFEAAKAADALGFIERLPLGFDTPLGGLGERLSGGQRQRIAIARALLKDSPVLLLDEATSSLDRESEGEVLKALQTLMLGRTVIVVSHSTECFCGITRVIKLER